MTLAATLCTADVAGSLAGGALMHGPTYMANPLACSVALASTEILADGRMARQVGAIEAGLRRASSRPASSRAWPTFACWARSG